MRRTGSASLPLHGGKAPAWLFGRMVRLSRSILGHLAGEHRDALSRASRLTAKVDNAAVQSGHQLLRAR